MSHFLASYTALFGGDDLGEFGPTPARPTCPATHPCPAPSKRHLPPKKRLPPRQKKLAPPKKTFHLWVELVDEFVGQHQVHARVHVSLF